MQIKILIALALLYATTGNINASKQSPISRAKTMIAGIEPYRKETTNFLYGFLRGSGLNRHANDLKKWNNHIDNLKQKLDQAIVNNLTPTEKKEYQSNQQNFNLSQVRMISRTLPEVNKLFNTIDNITDNVAKEIRDYRKAEGKYAPQISKIQAQINRHKQEIWKLNKNLEKIKKQLNPELKQYYEKMQQNSNSLFAQIKELGNTIKAKSNVFQTNIINSQQNIKKIKTEKAGQELKALEAARKGKKLFLKKIDSVIDKLSESERIRWHALRDLDKRVQLVQEVIQEGSGPIEKWKLSSDILRIVPPKNGAKK